MPWSSHGQVINRQSFRCQRIPAFAQNQQLGLQKHKGDPPSKPGGQSERTSLVIDGRLLVMPFFGQVDDTPLCKCSIPLSVLAKVLRGEMIDLFVLLLSPYILGLSQQSTVVSIARACSGMNFVAPALTF